MPIVPAPMTPSNVAISSPQVSPVVPTPLNLDEIQGDVLIGLQKKFQLFVPFTIKDVPAFKSVLRREIARRITSTQDVKDRELMLAGLKVQNIDTVLPLIGLNLALSGTGLKKLVPALGLGTGPFEALLKTPEAIAGSCDDPLAGGKPSTWDPSFLSAADGGQIDGVFLVTGGAQHVVDAAWSAVKALIGATAAFPVTMPPGRVRPKAQAGHEHFGWLDGISQPAVDGLVDAPFPGQDSLSAGHFVFGYPDAPPLPAPWMKDGSLMVLRQLEQRVAAFETFVAAAAHALGTDPVLLGARMMGRWKSGAPLALTPEQDDTSLAADPFRNNDFSNDSDQDQRRCPFAAHIRKVYPRGDLDEELLDPHRIIRQGIPFGDETVAGDPIGLMFVCYQTDIGQGFEFLQHQWADNAGFVFGKTRPPSFPPAPAFRSNLPLPAGTSAPAGSAVTVGLDPIIGQQGTAARSSDEPLSNYPQGDQRSTLVMPDNFVVPRAGAYFFVPSIGALANDLSA